MRLGTLDADLKALQINFPKRTFTDVAVRKITICFLVVAGEMLDRRRTALMCLYAERHRRRNASGKQRILRVVFKIPSAKRGAENIHGRCQPDMGAKLLHLLADQIAALFYELFIPRLCQPCPDRNRSAVLIIRLAARFFRCSGSHRCSLFL